MVDGGCKGTIHPPICLLVHSTTQPLIGLLLGSVQGLYDSLGLWG